jgi:uroporphyrinogen decarboxylase
MRVYTAVDHVKAAFKRTYTDCVPVYLTMGAFLARQVGKTIAHYLQEPAVFANAQIKGYEMFQPDVVVMMADLQMEAEAIGNVLRFQEHAVCISDPAKRVLLQKGKLATLNLPDPHKGGRLPYYLEACERVREVIRDTPIGALVVGPWSIAGNLRGEENLIMDTFDDPDFVHDLLRFTTEVAKRVGDAIRDVGVGYSISEASASCNLVSPAIYREFIKPYQKDLIDYFKAKRVGTTLHICGYTNPIMEDIIDTGCSAFSMDAPSDLQTLKRVNQNRTVILGNLHTNLFTARTTKEELTRAIQTAIDIGAPGSAFMLSSGCEIPPDSDMERVHHFFNVARQYGRYENLGIDTGLPETAR